jgi:hypothetical protein
MARLRAEHAQLNPFQLKKSMDEKLRLFFTVLNSFQPEAMLSCLTSARATFIRESARNKFFRFARHLQ